MAISKLSDVFTLLFTVLAVANAVATLGDDAADCGQVQAALLPCLTYLEGGGSPPGACCDGIKQLKTSLTTTADRRAACECLKAAAAKLPTTIDANAAQLPDKCGAPIGFPVSRSVDCNSVN